MAMKPPDLLSRLPSVSEMLEKPPIRALAEQWNRSAVAHRVKSFLEEMGSDLRRRATAAPLPSIRELAERAARYVMAEQQRSLGTAINATGCIWSSDWIFQPLADSALQQAVAVGRDFVPAPAADANPFDCEPLLRRLTGAQAAAVVHSYAGGLWLTLASLASDRQVLVARAEIGGLSRNSLPSLAKAANVTLCEVGTTNRAMAADYEAAASPRAAAILKFHADDYYVAGETAATELDQLSRLARQQHLVVIAALGIAPLIDPPETLDWTFRSARSSLAAGVDLAVIRGDGLAGGPHCGILIGNRNAVNRVKEHPLFPTMQLDELRTAILLSTLELYCTSPRIVESLPVWQLLTAPVENLKNRAERMVPQLAQITGIAKATPLALRSPVSSGREAAAGWPSYGVSLAATDGDTTALYGRLLRASPSVIGRVEQGHLVLDLRTVFPRQDMQLIEAARGALCPDREPPANEVAQSPSAQETN